MEGLAAGAHIDWMSVAIPAAVHQVAEGKVGIERHAMLLPFLRLKLGVRRNVPAGQADQTRWRSSGRIGVFRYPRDAVVRPGLPKPVRCGFGIVAKALLGCLELV